MLESRTHLYQAAAEPHCMDIKPVTSDADPEFGDIVQRVFFDEKQAWVDVINYLGLSLFITLISLGLAVPMFLFSLIPFLRFYYIFKRRKCYVTTHNIVLKQEEPNLCGTCWPSRAEMHVQLQNVVNISLTQSFIQRWFDCWTLNIQTPGQGVATQGEYSGVTTLQMMQLHGVSDAQTVRKLILDMSARLKQGEKPLAPISFSRVETDSHNETILEIRDLVKEIRNSLVKQ